MSNEGAKISDRQIDEIRAIAEQYDVGTCLQCATAIKSYLKFQQIKGRHIRVDNLYHEGKPIDQWLQDLVVIPGNQLNLINKDEF